MPLNYKCIAIYFDPRKLISFRLYINGETQIFLVLQHVVEGFVKGVVDKGVCPLRWMDRIEEDKLGGILTCNRFGITQDGCFEQPRSTAPICGLLKTCQNSALILLVFLPRILGVLEISYGNFSCWHLLYF